MASHLMMRNLPAVGLNFLPLDFVLGAKKVLDLIEKLEIEEYLISQNDEKLLFLWDSFRYLKNLFHLLCYVISIFYFFLYASLISFHAFLIFQRHLFRHYLIDWIVSQKVLHYLCQ